MPGTGSIRPPAGREFAIGVALLVGVLVLAYGNIVFLGETLVSSANYNPLDDRFTHLRPGGTRGPAFVNWHDQGGVWWQWEPAGQFFGRHYRAGDVPMWDPTVAGGVDTHVNVTQAQYFPPYALMLVAGNTPLMRDAYHLLLLLASGVACFVLLRRNGFHRTSALFMGAGYMLSGTMTQNVSALLGQTYATLPLMVLAVDVLLDRLTWRALGGAALVVGLCTYSSFLPIVISGYLLIGIQALAYAAAPAATMTAGARLRVSRLAAFGAAAALAIAIAAFVLLPLAIAQQGNTFFESWYTGIGRMHYRLDQLPTLLSPRLFYDVYQTFPPARAVIPKPTESTTHFFYAGFVVVLLVALVRRDERLAVRRLTLFFGAAALILFAKLMGIPPVQYIAELPVLKLLHFIPYFSGAFSLALIGLAACGVEALISQGVTRRRFVMVVCLAGALLALVPLFAFAAGVNPDAGLEARLRYGLEVVRVVVVIALLALTVRLRLRGMAAGGTVAAMVAGLLLLELVPIAFHRRFERADVWNDVPEYIRVAQRDPELFRIHSIHDPALSPNTFQGVGLAGIGSLGVFNQPRYTLLIKRYFETVINSGFILPRSLLPSSRRVLDLLNVKYVVTHSATNEERARLLDSGFERTASDGNFAVYRNRRVWPRAFVAHDFRLVPDVDAAITAAGELESPDTVILEQPPGFAPSRVPAGSCVVDRYEPNRVVISGNSAGAGMLVFLDSYGPGWSATVNGRPTAIVPANAAFRGVEVPTGQWTATMEYRSPRAGAGLMISLAALGAAALGLLVPRRLPGSPPELDEGALDPAETPAAGPPPARPRDFTEVLQLIYRELYSESDHEEMRQVWRVLVQQFFQRRIAENATVVDVGAGGCWFINEVRASRRIAIDANPDTAHRAAPGVEVLSRPDSSLADLPDASVDHIFMSNFLEHLPSYREVIDVLATAFAKLRPGGSLLILQPNYRLEPVRYFDPIDHTVILTDRNLTLVLRALSFRIEELRVRFLPFTSKSRIPKAPWLVALYLRLRPLQWLMGGQTFIHARRPASSAAGSGT